jgi:hypothetical protein
MIKFSKSLKNFNFHNISKLELNIALCNKTITTLELDQYEVLWSRVQQY